MHAMQWLPISLLEPDMIIAREVCNDKNIVLVAEGTALTESSIARLDQMNISKVAVKGTPVALGDFMPKTLAEKLREMELGFSRAGDEALMRQLRVVVKAHFIKRDAQARGEIPKKEPKPEAETEAETPEDEETPKEENGA
jgi:hypothetical protein